MFTSLYSFNLKAQIQAYNPSNSGSPPWGWSTKSQNEVKDGEYSNLRVVGQLEGILKGLVEQTSKGAGQVVYKRTAFFHPRKLLPCKRNKASRKSITGSEKCDSSTRVGEYSTASVAIELEKVDPIMDWKLQELDTRTRLRSRNLRSPMSERAMNAAFIFNCMYMDKEGDKKGIVINRTCECITHCLAFTWCQSIKDES